jgi:hypothetical protein
MLLEPPEQQVLLLFHCADIHCFVAWFLVKSAEYLIVTNGSGIKSCSNTKETQSLMIRSEFKVNLYE